MPSALLPALAVALAAATAEPAFDHAAVVDQQQRALTRLGIWSALSIATGALLLDAPQAAVRDFALQQLAWGAADGIIAGIGTWDLARKRATPFDPAVEVDAYRRVLVVNAGLDVAYVAAGGWLLTRPDGLGHGAGVIAQGAFLLFFDGYHAWEAGRALEPGCAGP